MNGFFYNLPNIGFGILFLGVAWLFGLLVARIINAVSRSRGRPDLGNLMGSLAFGAIMIAAVLFSIAIIFPSVNPSDVFATLGIGSVAIGFAFKDILQNLLAGLLLLIRRPYQRGDEVVVRDFEGVIEKIESRATILKTYDGKRVIIPNSDIYTSPVVVNTAFEHARDEYIIGIGYGDSPEVSVELFTECLKGIDGVIADPAPEVLAAGLSESTVDLKARWWTASTRRERVHVRSRVVLALHEVAVKNGIDIPFPTQVVLFHDQTEETDGDRSTQREGWPAGRNPPKPRRLKVVQATSEDGDAA